MLQISSYVQPSTCLQLLAAWRGAFHQGKAFCMATCCAILSWPVSSSDLGCISTCLMPQAAALWVVLWLLWGTELVHTWTTAMCLGLSLVVLVSTLVGAHRSLRADVHCRQVYACYVVRCAACRAFCSDSYPEGGRGRCPGCVILR
jgi:hypothetical protein